jgi:hypothetical protein
MSELKISDFVEGWMTMQNIDEWYKALGLAWGRAMQCEERDLPCFWMPSEIKRFYEETTHCPITGVEYRSGLGTSKNDPNNMCIYLIKPEDGFHAANIGHMCRVEFFKRYKSSFEKKPPAKPKTDKPKSDKAKKFARAFSIAKNVEKKRR